MKDKLKESLSPNKTLIILSLIAVILCTFACILGEVIVPLMVAVLASIFLFDTKSKRAYSIVISFVIVGFNLFALFFDYTISFFSFCSIILAVLVAFAYKNGESKADSAYLMSIIAALFSVAGLALYAMKEQGSYSFDAVSEYYLMHVENLRQFLVESFTEMYRVAEMTVDSEIIQAIVDRQIYLIISYFFVGGFVISGIAMKIFGAIVSYCSADNSYIKGWRFRTTKIYGYLYVALIILSLFLSSSTGLVGISVANLYNIFTVVFAYIGFNVALDIFKKRRGPIVGSIVLIVVCVLFISFSAQILAAIGVLFTVNKHTENDNQKTPI